MEACHYFSGNIRTIPLAELSEIRDYVDKEIHRRENDKEEKSKQAKRQLVCPNPMCGSSRIVKDGHKRGKQIYRCRDCGKQFQSTSATCVSDAKLPGHDIHELVKLFLLDLPVWVISYVTNHSSKTIQYWRYQVSRVARQHMQNTILDTKIWIDETYWKITEKGAEYVNLDDRRKRGLSCDLVCVLIAYDIHGHYYCHVLDKPGKPNADGILGALKDNIARGSLLIHDGEKSHNALVSQLELRQEVVKTSDQNPDRRKLIQTIDNACALAKFEVYKHKGIRTNHLQEMLDLFFYKVMSIKKYGVNLAIEITESRVYREAKKIKYRDIWPIKKTKKITS